MSGLLFFRTTHEGGKPIARSPADQEACDRVWQATKTVVGHMLDHDKGQTLEQLYKEVLSYRSEHPEDHKWGPAARRGDVAQDLIALVGAGLAYQGHQKPTPWWHTHVLAYAVGHFDVRESPPRLKGVAIYSEFPVTSIGRGDVQVELDREYQRSPGEVYGDGEKRMRERIMRDGDDRLNHLAWIKPYLSPQR